MSYRTIKRVLGESSLERKCRILFGISMLVLMVSTYGWYGHRTKRLVNENTRSNSRHLVIIAMLKTHLESLAPSDSTGLAKAIAEGTETVSYQGAYLATDLNDTSKAELPSSDWEESAIARLAERYDRELRQQEELSKAEALGNVSPDRPSALPYSPPPTASQSEDDELNVAPIYETFKDAAPLEDDVIEGNQYHYVQVVRWKENCNTCHRLIWGLGPKDPLPFRAARITLPYDNTQRAVNKNYAILLATAILTVFLSMIALYIVVRYVIVKPLQHLQEVSEKVGQGNYEARAHIETNDEFEQLADAYNRMLRHLVDTQTELKGVNTEIEAKVDQLAQANMRLYEMNRVKSDFLATVSHELRTPLNSIIGFSDLLAGLASLDKSQKKYVSNIGDSGRALLEVINDILDLAKMESGKMQVRPTEFMLDQVVRSQCDVVQSLANEKNIDLGVVCVESPFDVVQDQAKVQQILTNLLSNAIKFTPEGGRITVRIQREAEQADGVPSDAKPAPNRSVRNATTNGSPAPEGASAPMFTLMVEDTGVGIAEEDREVIFEKFRQATATRGPDNLTREYSGTGLGLSIVKELCKMLGGEVSFTSQLGTGSVFIVRLPMKLVLSPDQSEAEGTIVAAEWNPAQT